MSSREPLAALVTLRRTERAAHAASAVAVVLTVIALGGAAASESNPVAAGLIGAFGLATWATLTPVGVAANFALLRVGDRRGVVPGRVGGAVVASVFALDALGNAVVLAVSGVPPV